MLHKILILFLFVNFCECKYKNSYIYDNRSAIAQLFEWKFSDIAKECKFLAKNGYGAVQISPVHEAKFDETYSWHLRYQPVSYKIHSRSGDAEELQDMIKECHKSKIRVYVDVVANHMANGKGDVMGTAKSIVKPSQLDYPDVPYTFASFNDECHIKERKNAFELRNCRIDSLPDLNQTDEDVKVAIVGFMNKLIDYGVAGFRMDSVMLMWPADLAAIYGRLNDLNTDFDFPPKARPFIYQEVVDLGGGPVSKNEYTGMGLVTEYLNSLELGMVVNGKKSLHHYMKFQSGFVASKDAITFVDNHDNQRNFIHEFKEIINHKDERRYILANAVMLAVPYGLPKIMSSFDFKSEYDGPPMEENGQIKSPLFAPNGTCINGWICEHRWPVILAMVRFRFVVGNAPISNYADNGQNQIAFCRGVLGFIAINNEISLNMKSSLKACLPPGVYCDIITGGKVGDECVGEHILVDEEGKVDIFIPWEKEVPIIAFHVESKLKSWTLTSLNITEVDRVIHVSVYYNRAFLCIRSSRNETLPSLVEATWPENLGVWPKVFPSESQQGSKCRSIQNAVSTDIDGKGRLWVIDEGNSFCAPKLFVYDLLYFNEEVHFATFSQLTNAKLSKIIVDPVESENGDTRAYISLHDKDYLLVYSLKERKLGKLKFINEFIQPTKSISFSEMVITQQMDQMYISDAATGNLYAMNLTPVRYLNFSHFDIKKLSMKSPLTFIGTLLGPSTALTISNKGLLLYIIPKFSAVVTWDPRTPLAAEWHEVIYQTTNDLSQVLCGHKGNVYVVAENVVKSTRDGRWKHTVKIHLE